MFIIFNHGDSLIINFMVDKKQKQRIAISLDAEALKSVSFVASQNDVSTALVVRYAVDKFLKEWKEGRQVQLFLLLGKKKGG